jgi:hypothetical protein
MKPPDDLCLFGVRFTVFRILTVRSRRFCMLALLLSVMVVGAFAQTATWTDSFVQGATPTTDQCQNWNSFRAGLALKNFASVSLSGTFDEVGMTISDPVAATELAQLLSSGAPGTVISGGHTWTVGTCGTSLCGGLSITLSVDGSSDACNCSDTYAIRPNSSGNQWGGINTVSCNAPSQTMRLVFHSGVSVAANGPTSLCPGGNVVLTATAETCTGPYSYLWSNGETTQSITVTQAGSYSVTVTGADGCSGISAPTAVSVSVISVNAGTDATFCNEPVQLNATGISGNAATETVNSFCLFDAPGGAEGCAFPEGEDVCTGALFYTSGSFSTTVSVSNPTALRYKVYYSAFSLNTSFILKLNNQEIGSFAEAEDDVTGACVTSVEGKFPRTFSFSSAEFMQYWNQGADNILTVEVVSGAPGVYLAGVAAEVLSATESYTWSPAEGLSNPSIQNPLASPLATTVYTVSYTDGKGCTATDQVEVIVNCNTAPVAVCKPVVVEAGVNCEAMVEAAAFNDGSISNTGAQLNFSVSPAGPYAVGETQVTLTVTDSNGESNSCTTMVTVTDNTLPSIVTPADLTVANDPGSCSATVVLTQPESSDNCGVQSVSNDHEGNVFPEGESIVTWTATDIHGNTESTIQKVTVINSTPVINSVVASEESVVINAPVTLTITYSDNNVNTATVDWGDLSAVETVNDPETTFAVSHSYSSSGSYSATITLTDECGKSTYVYQSIVVTKKSSGSVSAGGWFESPRGAYVRDPRAEGKATFSFSVAYTALTDGPVGMATFNFRQGKIKFRSASFDWLVINGQTATFQGSGRLNGTSGYGILISLVEGLKAGQDGSLSTTKKEKADTGKKAVDYIRVKIWDPSGIVVYDTQIGEPDGAIATTPVGAGSIEIEEETAVFGDRYESAIATSFGEESTSAYPNPFKDMVDVQFNSPSKENVVIQMMDLAGKVVYNDVFPASEDGLYSLDIPDDGQPGIFVIIIKQGKRVEFLRLVRE